MTLFRIARVGRRETGSRPATVFSAPNRSTNRKSGRLSHLSQAVPRSYRVAPTTCGVMQVRVGRGGYSVAPYHFSKGSKNRIKVAFRDKRLTIRMLHQAVQEEVAFEAPMRMLSQQSPSNEAGPTLSTASPRAVGGEGPGGWELEQDALTEHFQES